MSTQRYAEKFTSIDGLTSYTFPQYSYEWDSQQAFRPTAAYAVGADYPHDYMGANHWAKAAGQETVRFSIVGSADASALDTDIDTMLGAFGQIGLGKLYTLGADASRRWCYAKLSSRPVANVRVQEWMRQPVSLSFTRLSDWLASSLTTGTVTLNSSPKTFTITNPGNETVKGAAALLLTLRSGGVSGFTNPRLENLTTGHRIDITRTAANSSARSKVDCEKEAVTYSTDGGSSYSNDYSNVTLPVAQIALFALAPGDNSIRYTDGGSPNAYLDYEFYPAYA